MEDLLCYWRNIFPDHQNTYYFSFTLKGSHLFFSCWSKSCIQFIWIKLFGYVSEYHHLHNVLLVVNHKCGHCIQLHLQAKPEIITSFAWIYSVACFSLNVERMIKTITLGSRRMGSKQKFCTRMILFTKINFFFLFYLFPSSQCIILYKPNYIVQWFTGKAGQEKLSGFS